MTEPTAPDAPPASDTSLEETLDRVLGKYMDRHLHRWTYMAHADAGDLASDLADAARAHFTGTAADTPSPLGLLGVLARLQDAADHADYLMGPTVTTGPAATRVNDLRQSLYQAIAMLEAAREAPVNVQAPTVDPSKAGARLAIAAARLAEWAEARLIAATGLSVEVAYDAGTGTALIAEVREPLAELWLAGYNGLGDVPVPALEVPEDPAADPPLWATANAAMVELFRAVRCLQVEDVARLDQSKVLDARRSMEWVENMPTVLWPPLSIDDEEPF